MTEDDNYHFALSLVPSLIALPRHLNTKCRIEIMQTISKYATRTEAKQTSDTPPPPHQQTYSITHYPSQSGLVQHPQEQYGVSQNAAKQQINSTLPPAPSPAKSVRSYYSHFSEDDSQFSIFNMN
ncbi:unnamed protein product [Acanthoscelides obtectus]|uniref:BESS domain-containing protein n=1 Tax=Acanthoscelides obtectus TaxID=200917 RepID=A0A9P0LWC5_ACAOB|nr:unnamed protein product [Acanthoscelides obtectus]CAK1686003.1 hypothetical protein AOBTE_LOCUS35750 [Acanthoscelides obtectus]